MISNSTAFSASSLNVHRLLPSGAWEQASCVIRASTSPVILRGMGGVSRFLRSNVPMGPTSQQRFRSVCICRTEIFSAMATCASFQPGPDSLSSHKSSTLALRRFSKETRVALITDSSSVRSSNVSLIRYCFGRIHIAKS